MIKLSHLYPILIFIKVSFLYLFIISIPSEKLFKIILFISKLHLLNKVFKSLSSLFLIKKKLADENKNHHTDQLVSF